MCTEAGSEEGEVAPRYFFWYYNSSLQLSHFQNFGEKQEIGAIRLPPPLVQGFLFQPWVFLPSLPSVCAPLTLPESALQG